MDALLFCLGQNRLNKLRVSKSQWYGKYTVICAATAKVGFEKLIALKFFILRIALDSLHILFFRTLAAIYDAPTDTWTAAASAKHGRQGTSLVTVKDRIFAIGGWDVDGSNTNVVEEYISETDTW